MKKISLICSSLICGLTVLSASSLEETIQNVDFSGSITYRYDDRNKYDSNYTKNGFKFVNTFKTKVNDDIVANLRVIGGNGTDNNSRYSVNTRTSGSKNIDITVPQISFIYSGLQNTTINVGKQGIHTPWTRGSSYIGSENTGTGIVLNVHNKFLFGQFGWFNSQNFNTIGSKLRKATKTQSINLSSGYEDIYYALVKAKLPYVTLNTGYLKVDDILDAYTIGARSKAKFNKLKVLLAARYSTLKFDDKNVRNKLAKVDLRLNYGIWGAKFGYGQTGKDGGLVAIDSDNTGLSGVAFEGSAFNLNDKTDANLIKTNINVNLSKKINLALNYNMYELNKSRVNSKKINDEEWYSQITYKMSKNFSAYVKYGQVNRESKAHIGKRGRIQLKYTF